MDSINQQQQEQNGDAVAFVKMAAGAVMGKTLNDSIEGQLTI